MIIIQNFANKKALLKNELAVYFSWTSVILFVKIIIWYQVASDLIFQLIGLKIIVNSFGIVGQLVILKNRIFGGRSSTF